MHELSWHPDFLFPASNFVWLLILLTLTFFAPHAGEFLKIRLFVSFVVFNNYTSTLASKYIATNDKLKWLVIATVIGIPMALFTAYFKGVFSL
jgi:hypothetical protein